MQIMESLGMATELNDESKKKGLKDGDVIEHKGRKVRVELIQAKVKNTEHPREHLYQGRTGYDYNKAMINLMSRMTEEQMEELAAESSNTLLMDEKKTCEWVRSLQPGDLVGVIQQLYLVQNVEGFEDTKLLHLAKAKRLGPGDYAVENYNGEVSYLSIYELDHARELGLLDILWRDGKPFGVPETRDMTLVLLHDLEEPNHKQKRSKKSQ
jgi:hypothetical protein